MSNKLAFNPLSGKFDYVSELSDSEVTRKLLTGYVSSSGTIVPTDTILQAIEKLNGNIAAASGGSAVATQFDPSILLFGAF